LAAGTVGVLPEQWRVRLGGAKPVRTDGEDLIELRRVDRQLPELPDARKARFVAEYGLSQSDAEVLTGDRSTADYYEQAVAAINDGSLSS
jgi:Asp-tRNA(Asn)/Glu-tRNA(Gln) amidotransferase B subunit